MEQKLRLRISLDVIDNELELVDVFPVLEILAQDTEVVDPEILQDVFCVLLRQVRAAQNNIKIIGFLELSLQTFVFE